MSPSPHDPYLEESSGVEVQTDAPGMYAARCGTGPPREMSKALSEEKATSWIVVGFLGLAALFTVGMLFLSALFAVCD